MNATVKEPIDDGPSHQATVGRDGYPDVDEDAAPGAKEEKSVEGAEVVVCEQGGDDTAWEADDVEDEQDGEAGGGGDMDDVGREDIYL